MQQTSKAVLFNVASYSLLSGLLACVVSISVKLAFNTDIILTDHTNKRLIFNFVPLKLIVQVVFICLSFLFNSLMWIFYSKGLFKIKILS